MSEPNAVTRRTFLAVGTLVATGAIVTFTGFGCAPSNAELANDRHEFDAFLSLGADGIVTVRVPVPEIGQGVRTALAMLVAEELGVAWSSVRVEQARMASDLGPHPFAGGSYSVRAYWLPLRQLGAAVREAVCSEAADVLQVPAAQCVIDGRVVRVRGTRRTVALQQVLANSVARMPADRTTATLTDPSAFRLIGHSQPGIDVPSIIAGTREYGIDVAVPNMQYAVLLRPPVYGATVQSVNDEQARAVAGVTAVEIIEPVGTPGAPYAGGGVAVVATTTWAALRGRDALQVQWNNGANAHVSTIDLEQRARAALQSPGVVYAESGSGANASGRVVSAEYFLPLIVHAPMEPPCCTAHVRSDSCDVWAPTQMPMAAWDLIARRLELPKTAVNLHVTAIGGGFGRRLKQDFVLDAIGVARRVDTPVQVLWTRENDIQQGFYRPLSAHQMRATLDANGAITSWRHRQAGTSRYAPRPNANPAASEFLSPVYPGSFMPAHRLEYRVVDSPVDRGPLRAPGHNALAFPVECFLDELAFANAVSPLEFRRTLLRGKSPRPYDDEETFDPARMLAVIEQAVGRAGALGNVADGVGRGVAAWFTFGSYCAHVVEARVNRSTGTITVPRVWSAIDCGFAVDPDGVRAQVEGGVIDGLSAALYGGITIEAGRVVQSNFHDYQLLRHTESPRIDVSIIPRADAPTGAGEAPYPPVAPALANAVFAATGVRVRDLPFAAERVRATLRIVADDPVAQK